ncbi:CHASE3 domain-containing protein [Tsuneonella sp. HG222]
MAFLAPLIVALVALLLVQQVVTANRLRDAERASQERRAQLLSVLGAHQDVETGQRGYLITGSEAFLAPMRNGERRLDAIFPQLEREYALDPTQAARLDEIERVSEAKRAFSRRTVELRKAGDDEAATAMVRGGDGKALMDRLRALTGEMIGVEVRVLGDTAARFEQATTTLRWLTFGLLALLLILLASAAAALRLMWIQRREAMIALEDTAVRRAAILDSAMDGIITLNPSGSIEGANTAAVRMFGFGEEELISRDVGMLFATPPPIGQVAASLRDMQLEAGNPGALQEIVGRRKDGSTFPADVAVTAAPLAEGLRYVAVIRDITDRQKAEQVKAEFVATVSHELRTPLTSIAGSLGLLAGGAAGELSDRAARLIAIAHTNADRLVRLINDILDIEKLESGKMRFDNRLLSLAPAAEQAVEQMRGFADTYKVGIRLNAAEDAWVFADPDRLTQVLTNLLSNAIKFSPEHGEVRLTVVPGRKRHLVSVSDDGPGIVDEFRSRIFGKFAQADSSDSRSKGGTGLGLSIVHEIVTRLGGSISFDSRPGEGTQFHVHLPAVDPELDMPEKARTVLLAGENLAGRLREALRGTRYDLVVGNSPADVRRLLDTRQFDAMLLDMSMTNEDPVQIVRFTRLSILNERVPIIAIGGHDEGQYASDPTFLVDWLHKPAEIGSLSSRLDASILHWEGPRPRILHVDDDPDILRVVRAAIGEKADVTPAQSLAAARAVLAENDFDLIILDLTLRDGNGAELLADLRQHEREVPIIVFSAEDSDQHNLDRLQGFLTKARTPIERLVSIVQREIARKDASE